MVEFKLTGLSSGTFGALRNATFDLSTLTFFIGANASGKTSFVDAILFVASALRSSLQNAISNRGGIHSILHHPIHLPAKMQFEFYLSSLLGLKCEFFLELEIVGEWSVSVARETCTITTVAGERHHYVVQHGNVQGSAAVFPAVSEDRIFLSNASGLPEFRLLFDFLAGVGSTEPTPPGIHQIAQRLHRTARMLNPGSEHTGLAARFRNLTKNQPDRLEIIQEYLRAIAPPFDRVDVIESNDTLWLRFIEKSPSGAPMPIYVSQASAGLVNSSEILLELFESPGAGKPASPVIIEEPEALLHPGAIQVIRDSFIEAKKTRQVLVTTHSPDLLDDPAVPAEWIRTVYRDETGTHVDGLDPGTKSIIRDQLYTAGQLLRQGGLILKS